MTKQLVLLDGKRAYTTTRIIAEGCDVKHKALMDLVRKYADDIVKLGPLPLFTEKTKTKGRPGHTCRLNFEQTLLLIGKMRNTARINDITFRMIAAFPKANRTNILGEILANFDAKDLPIDRYVYVAKEIHSGRYKVGISKNPTRRVKELNIGNPEELVLFHVYRATEQGYLSETKAHETLKKYHIRSEWFSKKADIALLPR